MAERIYIVEDEENIREIIVQALKAAGYEALAFEEASPFFLALKQALPAVILLDIMLPGMSGIEILKEMKRQPQYADLPVIFLTAKTSELDRVQGLDLGADDYIVKPFGVLELISRVKAVLRRYDKQHSAVEAKLFAYRDLLIDDSSKEIHKAGETLKLTYKEYELFMALFRRQGMVMTREMLLQLVWGYDFEGETRTVDMHIKSLRQKLGDSADDPDYILTVRGYGYKLRKV